MAEQQTTPVEVTIKNWSDQWVKPPPIRNSAFKTYVIDPTGPSLNGSGNGNGPRCVQICDYEPNRFRVVIHVIDHEVALLLEPPTTSPDATSPIQAPQGLLLAALSFGATAGMYTFYGPDAMWLNAVGSTGRVTVLKEYC